MTVPRSLWLLLWLLAGCHGGPWAVWKGKSPDRRYALEILDDSARQWMVIDGRATLDRGVDLGPADAVDRALAGVAGNGVDHPQAAVAVLGILDPVVVRLELVAGAGLRRVDRVTAFDARETVRGARGIDDNGKCAPNLIFYRHLIKKAVIQYNSVIRPIN